MPKCLVSDPAIWLGWVGGGPKGESLINKVIGVWVLAWGACIWKACSLSRNWSAPGGPSRFSKTPEVKASGYRKYKCRLLQRCRPRDPKLWILGQESLFSQFITNDSGAQCGLRFTAVGFSYLCSLIAQGVVRMSYRFQFFLFWKLCKSKYRY